MNFWRKSGLLLWYLRVCSRCALEIDAKVRKRKEKARGNEKAKTIIPKGGRRNQPTHKTEIENSTRGKRMGEAQDSSGTPASTYELSVSVLAGEFDRSTSTRRILPPHRQPGLPSPAILCPIAHSPNLGVRLEKKVLMVASAFSTLFQGRTQQRAEDGWLRVTLSCTCYQSARILDPRRSTIQ